MPTNENSFMNDVTGKHFPQNGNNIESTNNKHVPNMSDTHKGKPAVPNNGNGSTGMPPTHNDASNMHLGPYPHPMQHHHMPPELEQQHQQQQQACATFFWLLLLFPFCCSSSILSFLLSKLIAFRARENYFCNLSPLTV